MNGNPDQNPPAESLRCHLCHQPGLEEFAAYRTLRRVTSDCRPWPAGGRLCLCSACGSLQKSVDEVWQREIDAIYASYHIYHQAAGAEQAIFEQSSGAVSPRSSRLLRALVHGFRLPEKGRMLDIGCGNGATLRAFHELAPRWSLAGSDLDAKERLAVESIPGVERLYTCPTQEIPGEFDLITMVHVLEHIPDPEAVLASLGLKLGPGGLLLMEVPDYTRNPFDLMVADHCTHFTAETIRQLMRRSGCETAVVTGEWIAKELSVVATRSQSQAAVAECQGTAALNATSVGNALAWLHCVADAARFQARNAPLGLFGTSIAAVWLFGALEEAVAFFVDEDENRAGRQLFGRPIYHPSGIPPGSRVFVAMPPAQADSICRRIAREGVAFYAPPAFPPL